MSDPRSLRIMVDAGVTPVLLPWGELSIRVSDPDNGEITTRGQQRITRILGGTFVGPGELSGTVLAGGADHQLVRPDGTIEIDARYEIDCGDADIVEVRATGIRRAAPDGVYFRVAIAFASDDPELQNMFTSLYVADGVRDETGVRHRIYEVG